MRSTLSPRILGATLLVVLGVACGDDGPSTPRRQGPTGEQVTLGVSLAQIRGHHIVALELHRAGDDNALTHAGHPNVEIFPAIEREIAGRDASVAELLKQDLEAVLSAIRSKRSPDEVSSAIDSARGAVVKAEAALFGTLRTSDAYRGSVVAGLVSSAAHEYEEAVQGGKVAELIEYQDAYGFVRVAEEMYGEIERAVKAAGAKEADEIKEGFGRLTAALPGPVPPAKLVGIDEVENAAALIGAELAETLDAVVARAEKPTEVVERIEELLDRIVTKYEEGKKDEAAELAAEAYLENYEIIEADVIKVAKDVNTALEPILGSQLRARIKAGASAAEIRSIVDRAKTLLGEALDALKKS